MLTPEPFLKLLPLESARWQILEQMLSSCPWLQRRDDRKVLQRGLAVVSE